MDETRGIRLFSASIPIALGGEMFKRAFDYYSFFYLFTPSMQMLKKKGERGFSAELQRIFDPESAEIMYACGRFFNEEGELSWISEDGTIYCSLCGANVPKEFKELTDWEKSDFILPHSRDHELILWNPAKKHMQWEDIALPVKPDYGLDGEGGIFVLNLKEWFLDKNKEPVYIQYVSISRLAE